MRGPIAVVVVGLALNGAFGQTVPTELNRCNPDCREALPTGRVIGCGTWTTIDGRAWWGPLRNAGPIQVSIEAFPLGGQIETLPLFAEIRVPLGESVCSRPFPGSLIWRTYGRATCDPDSSWVTSPVMDISSFIPLGETYYFQLEGFITIGSDSTFEGWAWSPAVRCVQLRSFPTSVLASSWGHVKSLFR